MEGSFRVGSPPHSRSRSFFKHATNDCISCHFDPEQPPLLGERGQKSQGCQVSSGYQEFHLGPPEWFVPATITVQLTTRVGYAYHWKLAVENLLSYPVFVFVVKHLGLLDFV